MRRQLAEYWSLDIDPKYSCRYTEDGFTIFTKPGMEISVVVYGGMPDDPDAAVPFYLSQRCSADPEFEFHSNAGGIAGRAVLTRKAAGCKLLAVASALSQVVEMEFEFQEQTEIETAIRIWHSLQCDPPQWVRTSGQADPPRPSTAVTPPVMPGCCRFVSSIPMTTKATARPSPIRSAGGRLTSTTA